MGFRRGALSTLALFFLLDLVECSELETIQTELSFGKGDKQCKATNGKPSKWGHIYFDGGVEQLEFFTSDFSTKFPCKAVELTKAKPEDACARLSTVDVKGKFVLVARGNCEFAQKAEVLHYAGAAGMILVNTVDNSLFSMPTGKRSSSRDSAFDKISSVMVRHRTGRLLEHALQRVPGLKVLLRGEHMNAVDSEELLTCGDCHEGEVSLYTGELEERDSIVRTVSGGVLHVMQDNDPKGTMDFFIGLEGSYIPTNHWVNVKLVDDSNEFACDDILDRVPKETFILAKRGVCAYGTKQQNAAEAGAAGLIVYNTGREISTTQTQVYEKDIYDSRFLDGTILAVPVILQNEGLRLRKLLQESKGRVKVKFEPMVQQSLEAVKSLKVDFGKLQYWKNRVSGGSFDEDFNHFISQLGFNEENEATVRRLVTGKHNL